jgi:hypothetical protein
MDWTQIAVISVFGGVLGGVIAVVYLGVKAAIKALQKPKAEK